MAVYTSLPLVQEPEEYDFVEPPEDEYVCRVCLDVLKEPHLTTCCGQHFCKACLERIILANQPCPLCQQEGFLAVIDKKVERKIKGLKVKCPNKDRGCEWVGEMSAVKYHLDPRKKGRCQHSEMMCPKGCGAPVPVLQLDDHLQNICPKRDCVCDYCRKVYTYEESENHLEVCEQYPVACPNGCSEGSLTHGSLKHHLPQCPFQLVDCEFANVGCNERVRRGVLVQHMHENTQRHLGMMSRLCYDLVTGTQEKQQQIMQIQQKLQQRDHEIECLHEALQRIEVDFQAKLQLQQKELHAKLQEKDQQVLQLQLQMEEQGRQGSTQSMQHRVQILETLVSVPPYYFTLTNYALHKRGTTQWMCPPFYTHLGGYKMAIEISANGEGYGKGSHISVYIRIMRGEYDDQIKWPLRASVTLQLISQQRNDAHYEMTTPYYEWAQVTDGVVGAGWGWDKFIAHTDVEFNPARGTAYLKNDRLNFRVICVDTR